jgi:hypothetical protein
MITAYNGFSIAQINITFSLLYLMTIGSLLLSRTHLKNPYEELVIPALSQNPVLESLSQGSQIKVRDDNSIFEMSSGKKSAL